MGQSVNRCAHMHTTHTLNTAVECSYLVGCSHPGILWRCYKGSQSSFLTSIQSGAVCGERTSKHHKGYSILPLGACIAVCVRVCALQLLVHSRVQDVECHMQEVGNHMHIALWASTSTLTAEGPFLCKAQQ